MTSPVVLNDGITNEFGRKQTAFGLETHGINEARAIYWNLTTPELYEEIVRRGEGVLSAHGALAGASCSCRTPTPAPIHVINCR